MAAVVPTPFCLPIASTRRAVELASWGAPTSAELFGSDRASESRPRCWRVSSTSLRRPRPVSIVRRAGSASGSPSSAASSSCTAAGSRVTGGAVAGQGSTSSTTATSPHPRRRGQRGCCRRARDAPRTARPRGRRRSRWAERTGCGARQDAGPNPQRVGGLRRPRRPRYGPPWCPSWHWRGSGLGRDAVPSPAQMTRRDFRAMRRRE